MSTFYNKNTKEKATSLALERLGFPKEVTDVYTKLGWYPIEYNYQDYDIYSQKMIPEEELIFDENKQKYIQNFKVIALTGDELVNAQERKVQDYSDNVRNQRDMLLSSTDVYMLVDYPLTEEQKEEVKAYRQDLRNLPSQKDFPWIDKEIPWPKKPSFMEK